MRTPWRYLKDEGIFGWNWWYVITHFWIIPGEVGRRIKWFVQRGWRGYSDRDNWSIDGFLLSILPPMLENLRKNSHGYPVDMTAEEWDTCLHNMIVGFECRRKLVDLDYDWKNPAQEQFLKRYADLGMEQFVKDFHSLWD